MTPLGRRRGERGSAMIVVAVGSLALIGVTGLAIDGGMAAGAYRHAQNAADAGALAAARQEYLNAMSSPPVASTSASLTPVATKEVQHNGAQFTSLTSGGLSGTNGATTTMWVPSTTGGMSAQADYAEIYANVPAYNPGGLLTANPTYTLDVLTNKAYGQIQMDSTVSPHTGSQASSLAETMNFNSQITTNGDSGPHTTTTGGDQNCLTASAQYSTTPDGSPTSCSNNSVLSSLPSPINTALQEANTVVGAPNPETILGSPNPDAHVNSDNAPHSYPSMNQANPAASIVASAMAGVSGVGSVSTTVTTGASAGAVHSDDVVGWDTLTGATMATANTSASNVNVTTGMVNVSSTNLAMSVSVSMGPTDSHPVITPSCAAATLTFSAGARLVAAGIASGTASGTSTVNQDCSVSTPPNIPDVTMTGGWYSPAGVAGAPPDYTSACSYNSGAGTWSCSLQSCLLRIVETDPTTEVASTVCLLQSVLGFGVTSVTIPNTASALLPQYIGAVAVTANVPQNTYFMRALGWNQTDPSATAVAAVANVVDESPTAFAASPFGIPNSATVMGGAAGQTQCAFQFSALLTGCYYYLYGSSMQTYNPCALSASWYGTLDPTSSGHKVGSKVVASSNTSWVPQKYAGTSYYLEPVFDAAQLNVLYYAVFIPVSGHNNWGELVNSVPALNGPIVTADTGAGWAVNLTPGAVSIKVAS